LKQKKQFSILSHRILLTQKNPKNSFAAKLSKHLADILLNWKISIYSDHILLKLKKKKIDHSMTGKKGPVIMNRIIA
jgi:hypothetical protein